MQFFRMYVAKISLTSTIIKNAECIAQSAKRPLEAPAPIYFLLVVTLFPSLLEKGGAFRFWLRFPTFLFVFKHGLNHPEMQDKNLSI